MKSITYFRKVKRTFLTLDPNAFLVEEVGMGAALLLASTVLEPLAVLGLQAIDT